MEQKQEIYFVVDQSRASALALDPAADPENGIPGERAPRRLLDLAVETALVGATVAWNWATNLGWSPTRMSQSPGCARKRAIPVSPIP